MDDTEDVSLDFGNEEELAFRKAKIRCVPTRSPAGTLSAADLFIPIHSFRMYSVPGVCRRLPTHPGQIRQGPALLESVVLGGGGLTGEQRC